MAEIARDTIPCPAPGSGEFPVTQLDVVAAEGTHAPSYVERVLDELRVLLMGARCEEHLTAPVLTVNFGHEDATCVVVVPHDCCSKLDDMVAVSLETSPIFRFVRPE